MPDDFIDLTVTSPPYDNLRDYKGYTFDFEALVKELYRVTKPGGVVVWVVGDATIDGSETGTSFKQALKFMEEGFKLHDTMIYHKENPTPGRSRRYQQSFEYMFIFSKGKPVTFNPLATPKKYMENRKNKQYNKKTDGTQVVREYKSENTKRVIRNIWSYSVGLYNTTSDKVAFKHPAIFPEKLAKDHILTWSNPVDVVFDPFMGSGTTAIAALDVGRKYIGAEIAKEYVDIANERIRNHTTQTELFDYM